MSTGTFRAYRQQIAEQNLSNEEILARYVAGAGKLEAALEGLTDADLDLTRAEGKWTIRQYVHHIVNGDNVGCACIQAAIGNPGCKYSLEWYDYEGWVEMMGAARRPVGPAVALLGANRRYVVDLVRGVPNAWERNVWLYLPWAQEWRERTAGWIIFSWMCQLPWHVGHIEETRRVCGR